MPKSKGRRWLERIEARLEQMNEVAHDAVEEAANEKQKAEAWNDVGDTADALESISEIIWRYTV